MNIAYLNSIVTDASKPGGHVHVTQVANNLLKHGHTLYTNLSNESEKFIRLNEGDFFNRGNELDAFYIRIHGSAWNDELTKLRKANSAAPCIWEINAPLEELRTRGISETELYKLNIRRKKLAKMVDAAICVSSEMEEYARNFLGIDKTIIIPNGSDPDMFKPQCDDPDMFDKQKFHVIWSGSTEYAWQGYNIVEAVAMRLSEIDKEILLVLTAEGKSTNNIAYLGRVSYQAMPVYIASADVGLCIYNKIDFYPKFYFSPLKLYDYMASGLPIIGNDVGQIKYILEENRNGLLTNGVIDDIADKIKYLKNNKVIASEMGMRSREAVVKKYNWERAVGEIENLLNELIHRKKSKTSQDQINETGLWHMTKATIKRYINH